MKRLAMTLMVFGVLLLFGVAAVNAGAGNTTVEIDPDGPPITVVISEPDGIAAIFFLPAGGLGFIADFLCIGPTTESSFQFNADDFPLTLNVTDCDGDSTEFVVELPSVGGTTSFLTGDSGSSTGTIALLAGGVAAAVAIAASSWYTRRRWLGS